MEEVEVDQDLDLDLKLVVVLEVKQRMHQDKFVLEEDDFYYLFSIKY